MCNFSAVLIFVLCNTFSFIEQGSTVITSSSNDNNPSASGTTSATDRTSVTEIEEQSTDQQELEEIVTEIEEQSTDQQELEEIERNTDNKNTDDDVPESSKQTKGGNHDAFILLRSLRWIVGDKSDFKLPTRYSYHKKEKLHLTAGELYFVETPLCPEIQTTDEYINILMDNLDEVMPQTKGCLFIADDGQEKCVFEPSAKLQVQVNTNIVNKIEEEIICGINDQQKLIKTVFLNCGSKENMRELADKFKTINKTDKIKIPKFEVKSYPMYSICYDFKNQQTLWTEHEVRTTALLAHKKYPYKSLDTININDFSTLAHNTKLNSKTLEKLKAAYASTELNKTMIQSLVPKEHMALPHWKKSTTHMINTASLLPKFQPLMKAINEGIFKASAYAFAKYGRKLKIYTKTTSKTNPLFTMFGMVKVQPSNIWYKFIHDEEDRSGLLIVLQNTKQLVEKKECTDPEMRCNFQTWINDETLIPKETLKHAYCCHVSEKQIEELFSMKQLPKVDNKVYNELQLQEIINLYQTVIQNVPYIGDISDFKKVHDRPLDTIFEN